MYSMADDVRLDRTNMHWKEMDRMGRNLDRSSGVGWMVSLSFCLIEV